MFPHVISDGERLDHLADHYYGEPTSWWHICDANPEFISPLAMIRQEPIRTCAYPLLRIDTMELRGWAELARAVSAVKGVLDVALREQVRYVSISRSVSATQGPGAETPVVEERFDRAVIVTVNQHTASLDAITKAIRTAGFDAGSPTEIDRGSRRIVIPRHRAQ
ncbi:MAG: hypothetical protein EOP16_00555 [Pseudonocardia sp.]|nr:MAG: hypothetical protein EOP16_00555 [Pseudonocardia sp.]